MKTWRTAAVLAAAAVLATACGGGDDAASGDGLSGAIEIDGSSTVGPLTDAIAEEYANEEPGVDVVVNVSGSGGGFERFCNTGDTDISNASRPIKDEEAQACEDNGISFVEVRVGTDALTMVTSPETDFVDCLTTEEVARIFGPEGVSTWAEVRDGLPDTEIQIFAPDTDSGTYDFMVEDVLGVESSRQDYSASADDNIIVQGVQATPGAWGFFGYAFFQENEQSLKAFEYDAGDGCVAPSVETAQDGSYEMTRPLYVYIKESSLQEKEQVADFVQYYLENVNLVIEDVGYIPAPQDVLDEASEKVQSAIGG